VLLFLNFLFQLGSWEGDIRIWKLDSKLNSFSLVGKIPASGVVNSLQLLTPQKGFLKLIVWGSAALGTTSQATKEVEAQPLLLVAGLGQEHRLGRWLKIKEGGAVNEAMVVAFSPRTLP
jgi:ribosomal RNA-processing protein 9